MTHGRAVRNMHEKKRKVPLKWAQLFAVLTDESSNFCGDLVPTSCGNMGKKSARSAQSYAQGSELSSLRGALHGEDQLHVLSTAFFGREKMR